MAIPLATIKMQNKLGTPMMVLIAYAIDKSTGKPVSCGSPAWHVSSSGDIVIDSIAGLSPGGKYRVKFSVLG